jgi:CRISPR/Cas system CSM-associated protein Csm5 (group 7 of RAMP superfamily)
MDPCIPGSSLKGVIRTAVLDRLNSGKPLPAELKGDKRAHTLIEEKLLRYTHREMESDPFRFLKVGDVRLPGGSSGFAVSRRTARTAPRGIPAAVEVLKSVLMGGSPECGGEMRIFRAPAGSLSFTRESIVGDCSRFYKKIFEEEKERFKDKIPPDVTEKLDAEVKRMAAGECLIRIGGMSHAESKSLEGVRDIEIRQGRGRPSKSGVFGTTRNLCEGKYPFGWAVLSFEG